jgi:hypothetical protein
VQSGSFGASASADAAADIAAVASTLGPCQWRGGHVADVVIHQDRLIALGGGGWRRRAWRTDQAAPEMAPRGSRRHAVSTSPRIITAALFGI